MARQECTACAWHLIWARRMCSLAPGESRKLPPVKDPPEFRPPTSPDPCLIRLILQGPFDFGLHACLHLLRPPAFPSTLALLRARRRGRRHGRQQHGRQARVSLGNEQGRATVLSRTLCVATKLKVYSYTRTIYPCHGASASCIQIVCRVLVCDIFYFWRLGGVTVCVPRLGKKPVGYWSPFLPAIHNAHQRPRTNEFLRSCIYLDGWPRRIEGHDMRMTGTGQHVGLAGSKLLFGGMPLYLLETSVHCF